MATKGSQAKEQVTKVITDAFGENFIAISDKKIYVWADDGGEKVQIAISMTMPKTQINAEIQTSSGDSSNNNWANNQASVEISPEDAAAVERLKQKFGLM